MDTTPAETGDCRTLVDGQPGLRCRNTQEQKRNLVMNAKNESVALLEKQHFRFENSRFNNVVAHGGSRPILTCRVVEARRETAVNFIDFAVVPVGGDIGIHTHSEDNEEVYIIISGQGEMVLDGRKLTVGPGHVVVNRPGGTHGLKNTGSTDLRLVVIEVPVTASR